MLSISTTVVNCRRLRGTTAPAVGLKPHTQVEEEMDRFMREIA